MSGEIVRRGNASRTLLSDAIDLGTFYCHDDLRSEAPPDSVLYAAIRDFQAPAEASSSSMWRFDRVTWSGPDFPTGELKRSIGHWNPPTQKEDFLCRRGEIWMCLARPQSDEITVIGASKGQAIPAPSGWWHVTYVSTRTAVVDNRYSNEAVNSEPKYTKSGPGPFVALLRDPLSGGVVALSMHGTTIRLRVSRAVAVDPSITTVNQLPDVGGVPIDDTEPAKCTTYDLRPGERWLLPTSVERH